MFLSAVVGCINIEVYGDEASAKRQWGELHFLTTFLSLEFVALFEKKNRTNHKGLWGFICSWSHALEAMESMEGTRLFDTLTHRIHFSAPKMCCLVQSSMLENKRMVEQRD